MSARVPASILARQRELLEASLPASCDILRPSGTPNEEGGTVEGEPVLVATYRCRVAPVTEDELAAVGGGVAERATSIVTLPALADVHSDDVVRLGTVDYQVLGVRRRTEELTRRAYVVGGDG